MELPLFICPRHKCSLELRATALQCPQGCLFKVVGSIPRFVSLDNYASSFGLQWNTYRTAQLDSHTGFPISQARLTRLLGGSLASVRGKSVLEAGCGAGRFSEILLNAGACLHAVDLSEAVEANYTNCRSYRNYVVCQASILELPFAPEQFDVVVCIGVIQHTPCPELTIDALCRQVKPGGTLILDHYTHGYDITYSRRLVRSLLLRLSPKFALSVCQGLTSLLWPLHRLFWANRNVRFINRIRQLFLRLSPIVDYHDSYSEIGSQLLKVWAALDTHDTLTDYFKHLRRADEIREQLVMCGMHDIEICYGGNGIEARARKLFPTECPSKTT